MTLDILEGDRLVVSGVKYNIRRVGNFSFRKGASSFTFARLANVSCSTERQAVTADSVDGSLKKRTSVHAANLTGLKCMPLDSVRAKLAESEGFGRTHTMMETMLTDSTSYVHLWLEREI